MTTETKKLLGQYCELAINAGICVQKGQTLVINSPVECAEITRMLTEEAYKSGAKEVVVRWNDEKTSRITYLNAGIEIFETFPKWEKLKMDMLAKEGAAFLSISASDPEIFKGVDSAKLMAAQKSAASALKSFRNKTMSNELQWCVISVPTVGWAKKVFPGEKNPEEAVEKLWKAIFASSRADSGNASGNWKKHQDTLLKNVNILNKHNFKSLHYQNSLGTDLTVGLPEGHIWNGGSSVSKSGVSFSPNIPTEEAFTAPQSDAVDGVVYSSRPLVYNGNIIDGFAVWFEKGRAVKVKANEGQKYLEELIGAFKNSDRLGEVALVPYNSPIAQSGILFFNTLYDENAACHFAFGQAYPECVKNTEGKSEKELAKMGLNICRSHHDFMIGTEDMTIAGIKHDGKKIKVFENGNFAF